MCVADPIDTTTPLGQAFFQIAMVFAELERKTITQRCNDGIRARAAQFRYARGSPPYGWSNVIQDGRKMLAEDPQEQKVIRRIHYFRKCMGYSFVKIAQRLEEEGNEPPRPRWLGNTKSWWTAETVSRIYREERALVKWMHSGCSYNYLEAR